jgi:hypothetical protein
MKDLHIAAGVLAALALTTGCSDHNPPTGPTGPTPMTAQLSPDVVEVGRIGGRADEATVRTWTNGSGWSTTSSNALEVEGTDVITSVAGVCPDVVLTVRGVPVTLNAATAFDSRTACAVLAPGQRVQIRGILTFTAAGLAVLATRIQLEDAGPRIEVVGVVAAVSGVCPALVITLQGIPGSIVTNAATEFTPLAGCSRIASGVEIDVEGTLTAPQQLTATELEIDDEDLQRPRLEVEGRVSNIQGTCPELTLLIRGFMVRTNAATQFSGGRCADIRLGTEIEVRGRREGDLIIAERVRLDDDDEVPSAPQMTICHIPPGNYFARHAITIDASAWPAHQGHCAQGTCDYIGSCR